MTCSRRSDWDFLRDFYQREEINRQQVQSLNGHVAQLTAALNHAGVTNQKERVALNSSHERMKELQLAFNQSEASRARLENELHEERHEHGVCQQGLHHERERHGETAKNLECIWNSHQRLGEIVSKIHGQVNDENHQASANYDITDLILETEAKAYKIQILEKDLEEQHRRSAARKEELQDRLRSTESQLSEKLEAKDVRLHELELRLHREWTHREASEERDFNQSFGSGRGRKRNRGRGRGKQFALPESRGFAGEDSDLHQKGSQTVVKQEEC